VAATDKRVLDTLPQGPPDVSPLDFTRRGEGWPPRPVGAEQVERLHAPEAPGALTDVLARQLGEIALRDARVVDALGKRHVHIHADTVIAEKWGRTNCSGPLEARLTFYSYDRQAAVEVLMKGPQVQSVTSRLGGQPAETVEEIQQAICLARSDPCLRDRVQLLGASAILLPEAAGAEEVGSGHRLLWVTFFDAEEIEDEKPALFSAVVDISDQVVIFSRDEPPIRFQQTGGTNA
jgi:hypothetical protein